jgi:NosR/NirI family nitrous oxide reductase transcriptional regulator
MRSAMRAAFVRIVLALVFALAVAAAANAEAARLARYLLENPAETFVNNATGYGPVRDDFPIAPVLRGEETLGWVFLNSELVSAAGYSTRPIDVLIAIDADAVVLAARLLDQSEPLLQSGRRLKDVAALVSDYAGRDLANEAGPGGSGVPRPFVSGVSVSLRVIEDSLIRAGLKVAFELGLGGLEKPSPPDGTLAILNNAATAPASWQELLDLGLLRRLSLENEQVNQAFAGPDGSDDAARFPLEGPPDGVFIDLYAGLVSLGGLSKALLREVYRYDLAEWLEPGDSAILVAARGEYSFRNPSGRQDRATQRIAVVQGTNTYRFGARDSYTQVFRLAADGAPVLPEITIFKIPAFAGFDPTKPWRLQLLVERPLGAIRRAYHTYEIGYSLPDVFITPPRLTPQMLAEAEAQSERAAQIVVRNAIWREKLPLVVGIGVMIAVLTAAFFFQHALTRSAASLYWFRIGFLSLTLVFVGWYANAQLSVVNLLALFDSARSGFDWETFLADPLTFVLWFSVAAALVFWGRGAYCGWLCPFGSLQELTNKVARWFGVPQIVVPWIIHQRLWALKYVIFLGLVGATLFSFDLSIQLAEVEPFRTAIALKFVRSWPYLVYLSILLGIGLFVERFYCRYLCPLGAALAIPARLRMFDWLERYRDCGNPCQLCARNCFVQAIAPTGQISPNECLGCLECQVLYQSRIECPVVVRREQRRVRDSRLTDPLSAIDAQSRSKP